MPASLPYILSEEFLSETNPYLLQLEIASAVLLGIGIVYEADKYPPSVHKSAFWFVVIGVVLETVFSILLFASEEHIASLQRTTIRDQQSKILSLETCLSPRAPLSDEQKTHISEALRQFAGTAFDIGIGPQGDPEPMYLAQEIWAALSNAGWKPIPWTGGGATYTDPPLPTIGLTSVTNVIVDVHPTYWAKYGTAATALAAALGKEGVAADAESRQSTINADAIHVRIGRKLCWPKLLQ